MVIKIPKKSTEISESTEDKKPVVSIAERISNSIVDKSPGHAVRVIQFEPVNPVTTGNVVTGDIQFAFQSDTELITGIVNRYSKKAKVNVIPLG
jgi:hypothetical protein